MMAVGQVLHNKLHCGTVPPKLVIIIIIIT
jgi:hypothetical protein